MARASMIQGRFVASHFLPTTGPATPNAAAVTRGAGLPRNARKTASSEGNVRLS